MRKHSYENDFDLHENDFDLHENDFDLHENETACRTHFHMKGFARRLVWKQRHRRTRNGLFGMSCAISSVIETSTCMAQRFYKH